MEDLTAVLERRSKAELVSLVRTMITRYPDLARMLDRFTATEARVQPSVDLQAIRRQLQHAFYGGTLDDLVATGDTYLQAGDWVNAAAIYQTVAEEIMDEYEIEEDEEGELPAVVDRCAAGMGRCLALADDPTQREIILSDLFDIYCWDRDQGGVGASDAVPPAILEHASPGERLRVAEWVEDILSEEDSQPGSWKRQVFGGLLLSLGSETLDDESYLRICRQTGRQRELVERLLALGRVDEAVAEVEQSREHEFLGLLKLFLAAEQADLAERLARERAAISPSATLTAWLKDRARERGDLAEALALATSLFWQHPSLHGYAELRDLAQGLGRWESLHPETLARLAHEQQYALLTEIHLQEGTVAQALQTVQHGAGGVVWGVEPLPIRVARAAEPEHPREAIRLYMDATQRLIAAQGRENYRIVARYLTRVRMLYERLGEAQTWQTLITELRERNRRLRAFQEELRAAGLA
jgi:hypothetical protein